MNEYYMPVWMEWGLIGVMGIFALFGIFMGFVVMFLVLREMWWDITAPVIGGQREDKVESARIIAAKAEQCRLEEELGG